MRRVALGIVALVVLACEDDVPKVATSEHLGISGCPLPGGGRPGVLELVEECSTETPPPSGLTCNGQFRLELLGTTPHPDRTTFAYRICKMGVGPEVHDLSHLDFELTSILSCSQPGTSIGALVVDCTPPAGGACVIGADPKTQVIGLKIDELEVEDFECEDFSFSIATGFAISGFSLGSGPILTGMKAGNQDVSDPALPTPGYQCALGPACVPVTSNQPPIAADDAYAIAMDGLLVVTAPGVLENDSDPDLDPLSAVLVDDVLHGSLDLELDGSFSYAPATGYFGPDRFTYRASDGALTSNLATVAITVHGPPVITSSPVLSATEDAPYVYDVEATGTGAIAFSLLASPAGMSIDPSSGVISWTPENDDVGSHPVTVRATDSTSLFADQSYTLIVANTNDPPSLTSSPILSAFEDTAYAYDVEASDVDSGDVLTFALDVAPAFLSIAPDTGLISGTPSASDVGSHAVTVRVSDVAGAFDTQSYTLEVFATNDPPFFTSTPPSFATEHQLLTHQVTAVDPENDSVTFSLDVFSSGMAITPAGLFTFTPSGAQIGDHDVVVRAEDPSGAFDVQAFTITVLAVNDAPVFTSSLPGSATEEVPYFFTLEAFDEEGDAFTCSKLAGPIGLTVSPSCAVTWTPRNSEVGPNSILVTATDIHGASSTSTFIVTVANVNDAPQILSTAPIDAKVGELYVYSAVVADPDPGEIVTCSLVTSPPGMSVTAPCRIEWTPAPTDAGTAAATLRATDASGAFDEESFTITVRSQIPPVASFRPAKGFWVSDPPRASIVEVTSQNAGAPASAMLDGAGWRTATGQPVNQSATIGLQDGALHIVDRIFIRSRTDNQSVRDFRVAVSTTGLLPADFTTILEATCPNDAALHEFGFEPVAARYAKLTIVDNYGSTTVTEVERFEVHSQARDGGIVSLFEGGAQIVSASGGLSSAVNVIDFAEDVWLSGGPAPQNVIFELRTTALIDTISVSGVTSSGLVKDFVVAVSLDNVTFTAVLTGVNESNVHDHWFTFDPVLARYVRFTALSVHSGTNVAVRNVRVYSPSLGGLTVPFEDRSTDADGAIVGWQWSFGDGRTSTEQHASHTYDLPGSYLVTLTITDDSGLSSTSTLAYTAEAPPIADFVATPRDPVENQVVNVADTSVPAPGTTILGRFWTTSTGVATSGLSPFFQFVSRGAHQISLTVTDSRFLTDSVSRPITVGPGSPLVDAGPDQAVVWGEQIGLESVSVHVPVGELAECVWYWGDATSTFIPSCQSANAANNTSKSYDLPGTYTVLLVVIDADGQRAEDSFVVDVHRRNTDVVITGAVTASTSGAVGIEAFLSDTFDRTEPIDGRTMTFSLSAQTSSAVTDPIGRAVATLNFAQGQSHTVTGSFAGDVFYEPAQASLPLGPANLPSLPLAVGANQPPPTGTRGHHFVLAFPPVVLPSNTVPFTDPLIPPPLQLMISSELPNRIDVSIPGLGHLDTVAVSAGRVIHINLPEEVRTNGGLESLGIEVFARNDITLYGASFVFQASEAFLVYPVSELGTQHLVMTQGETVPTHPLHEFINPILTVVAIEDGTTVTITPPAGLGNPVNIVLDALETYTLIDSTNGGEELTGTLVESNRPVGVFSGNVCINVPLTENFCNPLIEQMPPADTLGTRFALISLATRPSDIVRVAALDDATEVRLDGTLAATLDRGEHHVFDLASPSVHEITTTGPALVAQFSKGGTAGAGSAGADPFLMLLPPIDQYASNFQIGAPQMTDPGGLSLTGAHHYTTFSAHFLNVAAPTAGLSGLRLDSLPITATWTPIGATGLSAARLPVTDGTHRVFHIDPTVQFGVFAYGYGVSDGYGYVGEQRLSPIAVPCTPLAGTAGDMLDNDCDDRIDEELANLVDDDGDTVIDEDLARGQSGPNLAPVALPNDPTTPEDTKVHLVFTAFDPNGDSLTYTVTQGPQHGTLRVFDPLTSSPPVLPSLTNLGPVVTYLPSPSFSGIDTVVFTATDIFGATSNTAVITIGVTSRLDPPIIVTSAITSATQDVAYSYDVNATDADPGDTITFVLDDGPPGMTIQPATGVVSFNPTNANGGRRYAVVILAVDQTGLYDTQAFELHVVNTNDPPDITSTPPLTATPGVEYRYAVRATDPDPQEYLTFELVTAPARMRIDSLTGAVRYTPLAEVGLQPVTIRVRDAAGLADTQAFSIDVVPDTVDPTVSIAITPRFVNPGQTVTLEVTATDDIAVGTVSLTVNGQSVPLDANSRATFVPQTSGIYAVQVIVTDASGNVTTFDTLFAARDPSDVSPPEVHLFAPSEEAVVTAPSPITGSILDGNLVIWELTLGKGERGPMTPIASGSTEVANQPLAELDPTLLENGLYILELTAGDVAGTITSTTVSVQIQGGMKIGVFTLSFVDVSIPVSGIPITVTRTFDSRIKSVEDFGVGWTMDVAAGRYEHNRDPSKGWQFTQAPPPFAIPCNGTNQLSQHRTEVRLSDREFYSFVPQIPRGYATIGACAGVVQYVQSGGLTPGATLEILGNDFVVSPAGSNQLFDDLTLLPFNPQQVRLTTYDGRVIDFDRDDGIVRLEDRNGNELFITDNGITHSSGKSITFERDAFGRVEKITDPMGFELNYSYDVNGDLASFVDQEGNATTFTYDRRHNLLDIINPLGVRAVRSEYDSAGRLVATIDANGNRIELAHDLANRTETVTNRLGDVTVMAFDPRGNVIRETYPDSSFITRTFDTNDNMLSRTDELNRTTTFTYDSFGKRLTETNPLGHTSTTTWTSFGEIESFTDPRGAVTLYAYNIDRNLEFVTDPEGFVTERRYDSFRKDRVVFERNGRGHHKTFAHDAFGNMIREVDERRVPSTFTFDANGVMRTRTTTRSVGGTVESLVTTFTPDAMGRIVRTDHPDGSSTETVYDEAGRIEHQIDQLQRVTTLEYDDLDQRTATLYKDATSDTTAYDAEGRVIARTDRGGRTRTFTHDTRGRIVSVTFDGAATNNDYDEAGQLRAAVDANNHRTAYEYDLASRLVLIRDALLHESHYSYDLAGNLVSVRNAKHQTRTVEHDDRGLQTRIIYNDGTSERFEYDGASNLTLKCNQEDHCTQYVYDEGNNLIAVTDPTNRMWTFGYDELGNRISQTDPNLHSTTFAFDDMSREVRRTLPDGLFQQRSYDFRGNVESRANYSGSLTTYEYEENDRLEQRNHPDMPPANLSYTPTGRRATAVDARGITVYEYDDSDRLERITYPDGSQLSYSYDPAGNLLAIGGTAGKTTWTDTHAYSQRNELTSVATEGHAFTLTYGETGQIETLTYPNGLVEIRTYDDVDRLASIVTRNSQNQVFSSYAYTRYPDGNIETITEADGTLSAYLYDAADRLVQATVTSSTGALLNAEGYAYDLAGNRSTRFHTPASGVTSQFDSAYDNRDQITADGIRAYTFDSDGRMTTRSGADGFTLTWNSDDRLTAVVYAGGTVAEHAYDVDGERVSTSILPTEGLHSRSRFLLNVQRRLSHVVAVVDERSSEVAVRYVRAGDQIMAALRSADVGYFHADHIGSIRQLSNVTGVFGVSYSYDPFGELASQQGEDLNHFLFAGEPFDPSRKLGYHRARWRLPDASLFASADPLDGDPTSPATLARYTYAGNDPINSVDPSGAFTATYAEIAIAGLISGTLLAAAGKSYYSIRWASDSARHVALLTALPAGFGSPNAYYPRWRRYAWVSDALQHCMAACHLTQIVGGNFGGGGGHAILLGDVYEQFQLNPRSRANVCDSWNNYVGALIGEAHLDGGRQACIVGCQAAASNGELELVCNK